MRKAILAALPFALVAAGCGSTAHAPAKRGQPSPSVTQPANGERALMQQWVTEVEPDYDRVLADVVAIKQAISAHNLQNLDASCQSLDSDAGTVLMEMTMPRAGPWYRAGLTDYERAGAECHAGIEASSVSVTPAARADFRKMGLLLATGSAKFKLAKAALLRITQALART